MPLLALDLKITILTRCKGEKMAGNKTGKSVVMAFVVILLITMAVGIAVVMTGCGDSTSHEESMVSAPGSATGTPEDNKAVQDSTENPDPASSSETVTSEPGDPEQEIFQYSAAAVDCRFYDDGICTKTSEACTECIVP
jgi:hypothetical protein